MSPILRVLLQFSYGQRNLRRSISRKKKEFLGFSSTAATLTIWAQLSYPNTSSVLFEIPEFSETALQSRLVSHKSCQSTESFPHGFWRSSRKSSQTPLARSSSPQWALCCWDYARKFQVRSDVSASGAITKRMTKSEEKGSR